MRFSLKSYIKSSTKCNISCPIHGSFEITPNKHLSGFGCRKCGYINRNHHNKFSKQEFIKRCISKHNNKYDYSEVIYENSRSKILIICPKHGEFQQAAGPHLSGNGCPSCNDSRGEIIIKEFLIKRNINFKSEYKFIDCKNKLPLPFDFYLIDLNICIEFDGIQHYKPNEFFNKRMSFEFRTINDKIKTEYCENNKIKLIRIPYWEIKNIENLLEKNLFI